MRNRQHSTGTNSTQTEARVTSSAPETHKYSMRSVMFKILSNYTHTSKIFFNKFLQFQFSLK